jgi:hypothetical protein
MSKAAGISRVLKNSHFPRSTEMATRIRGWHNFTAGFVAENHGDVVVVAYNFGGSFNQGTDDQRTAVLLGMFNALTLRGYDAEMRSHSVVVRGRIKNTKVGA